MNKTKIIKRLTLKLQLVNLDIEDMKESPDYSERDIIEVEKIRNIIQEKIQYFMEKQNAIDFSE